MHHHIHDHHNHDHHTHDHHTHSHDTPSPRRHKTRRGFLASLLGTWAGAGLIELSAVRATVARAQSAKAPRKLFDIQKVDEGVYSAVARPAALTNSNATIFESASHLVVADTHSKPSAAAALIAQLRQEVSPKPVRYIVNTHFHWDHAQGVAAYEKAFPNLDIISSVPAKKMIASETEKRIKLQLEQDVPKFIEEAEKKRRDAGSGAESDFYQDQIQQLKAYAEEMKYFSLVLPTITFEKSFVIKDGDDELELSFHGRGHTSGDVVVYSAQKKLIASGDLIHGFFPFIGDGYPKEWPSTIGSVEKLGFDRLLPGHGPVQSDRRRLSNFRGYLEELTERVAAGKNSGQGLAELQSSITTASLKSVAADGYGDFLITNNKTYRPIFGEPPPLQEYINVNIEQIFQTLDRA